MAKAWLALCLAACGADPETPRAAPLAEGFEGSITRGWTCGEDVWVGVDDANTIKVTARVPEGAVDLATGGELLAVTGENVQIEGDSADHCDDLLNTAGDWRFDYSYQAFTGVATLRSEPAGLGLTLADVVLVADPANASDVAVPGWDFPAFPFSP